MISIPKCSLNDFIKQYERYKICKENKNNLLKCLNEYIIHENMQNCEIYFNKLIKYKCI